MKILSYDIETSYNIVKAWRAGYNLVITHKDIIKERAIICISYKWLGEKVQHLTWDSKQSDKKMLEKFINILNEADLKVTHNGDKFDLKWIRGRAIKHGISMPPDITAIDTCKESRKLFNLNSNKLDYIAQYLGVGGKIATGGLQLWDDVILNKDPKALKKMVRYCDNDVVILEKVYNKMLPYMKAKLSISEDRRVCPHCSGRMHLEKHRILASGTKQVQLQCNDCGKYNTIPLSIYNK